MQPPRLSVVIPTHQRRDEVVAHVRAFGVQTVDLPFEVIVVVDGSSDGSGAALRALETPFPLRVIEQTRSGAGAARNRGAEAAAGEILLFLDDDMEPDPGLLAAHERRHREGADAVLGHMPLHPSSPRRFLARDTDRWVEHRRRTLSASEPLAGEAFLSGQASVSKRLFDAVGGFDERFTRGGAYGGEDTDFGLRLVAAGGRLVYEPSAVSRQLYRVDLLDYLRRYQEVGRAFVELLRKYPNLPETVVRRRHLPSRFDRWIGRWLAPIVERPLVGALNAGLRHRRLERVFYWLQSQRYWRGVRKAGGYPRRGSLRVLAYHSLRDLSGQPVVASFGVPAAELRRQLRRLVRWGFHFVSPEEVVAFLADEGGMPRRAVLLTFDDAYVDLVTDGLPVLRELAAPAVVFAVAGKLGGHNDWDAPYGAPRLPLCDAGRLAELAAAGVEVGSHGLTHARLDRLSAVEIEAELHGAAEALLAAGLPRPRLVAYPYGACAASVRDAARRTGYIAGFTVRSGRVTTASEPFELPRIEILRRDRGWRFLAKVLWAGGPRWRRPAR